MITVIDGESDNGMRNRVYIQDSREGYGARVLGIVAFQSGAWRLFGCLGPTETFDTYEAAVARADALAAMEA